MRLEACENPKILNVSGRVKNSSQDRLLQSHYSRHYSFNFVNEQFQDLIQTPQISDIFKNPKVFLWNPEIFDTGYFGTKPKPSSKLSFTSTSRVSLVTNKRVEFYTFKQGRGFSIDFKITNHACAIEIMKFLKIYNYNCNEKKFCSIKS